ncbi:PEP-CTERM sorting domain-containing protein [Kiritimatiellaeota bacterium B1221]|nr:PEP-CTERM sorting domain-containing protein [Kiritimatiellaeota bacterium B1221]
MQLSKLNLLNARRLTLPLIAAAFLTSMNLNADILASWDVWGDNDDDTIVADVALTGFSAEIEYDISIGSTDNQINSAFGSNDGGYGSALSGASNVGGALLVRGRNSEVLTITLTNSTGFDYNIDSVHFDFASRTNGFRDFSFEYSSGGLGPDETVIGSENDVTYASSNISNMPDFDYNLSNNLSDIVLGNGEEAVFTFTFSDFASQDNSSILDNVAFTGSVIPEPGSLLLLLAGLSAVFFFRKRK